MERAIFLALTLSLLAGCASKKVPMEQDSLTLYQQKVLQEDQRTNEVLAKAAALSAKSMAVFVRTEQALHQKTLTAEQVRIARFQADYIPVGMEQKIEYAWDGAPEALLIALASNSGYRLVYANQRPPISKSVTVSSEVRMISQYIDIVRQQTIGYIKEIRVDDKSSEKTITVFYAEF